jgi:predicted SprT family Zn-dependent metalloprotease
MSTKYQEAVNAVRIRCQEVMRLAQQKYGVDMSRVAIRFDLRGRCAGQAMYNGHGPTATYAMRFNTDMLTREAFDHVLNDTVPHEVAHIVAFMKGVRQAHGYQWRSYCIGLGGSGETYHQEAVVYGKGNTYEYTTDRGHKVRLSEVMHRKVQSGRTLSYRRGMGTIRQGCHFTIVGMSGQTLKEAIVPRSMAPAPAPAPTKITIVDTTGNFTLPKTIELPATPAPAPAPAPVSLQGTSKAAVSRELMLRGYRSGRSFELIIQDMILANGYNRQLARATFFANAPRVGIPESFYR